jgi:hypothetical protein
MATTKVTFGNLLTTVSTTANTITATIGAVGVGADMLTAYVTKQRDEQAIEYKLEGVAFEKTCMAAVALRLANAAEDIAKQKQKSLTFAASFDYYYAMLEAVE